jgi:hypothetical protein
MNKGVGTQMQAESKSIADISKLVGGLPPGGIGANLGFDGKETVTVYVVNQAGETYGVDLSLDMVYAKIRNLLTVVANARGARDVIMALFAHPSNLEPGMKTLQELMREENANA